MSTRMSCAKAGWDFQSGSLQHPRCLLKHLGQRFLSKRENCPYVPMAKEAFCWFVVCKHRQSRVSSRDHWSCSQKRCSQRPSLPPPHPTSSYCSIENENREHRNQKKCLHRESPAAPIFHPLRQPLHGSSPLPLSQLKGNSPGERCTGAPPQLQASKKKDSL